MLFEKDNFNGIILYKHIKASTMAKEKRPHQLSPKISDRLLEFMEDYSKARGYNTFKRNSIATELMEYAMDSILEETKGVVNFDDKVLNKIQNINTLVSDMKKTIYNFEKNSKEET